MEQRAELLVFAGDATSCDLDFRGGLDAMELVFANAVLQLLDVLLLAGTRATLVVADSSKIGASLFQRVESQMELEDLQRGTWRDRDGFLFAKETSAAMTYIGWRHSEQGRPRRQQDD